MVIFKQNHYIALLVGVILVCFSAINLLHPGQVAEGKINTAQMSNLESGGGSRKPLQITYGTLATQKRIQHPKLSAAAVALSPLWKTEKLNLHQLTQIRGKAKPATVIQVKAAALKPAPNAQKMQQKTATATKGSQTAVKKVAATQLNPPTTLFFSRTKLLSQDQRGKATWHYAVSEEDLLLLQKIVMAEAEGEPYQGKVAVANVVLNRLRSANFPDTIYKVIHQKRQFSPVANGRLKRVKPNADSIKAVNAALSGVKEVTDDTYYFLSLTLAQDLTVHHSQTYVKTIGNHTFYK
ncbi:cell wall hydrolase [Paenibacillus albidus]|uniref:cell wall hydrolase n=1 Tax=Paenibacillus albidus TaxID=2041023 RepID=UPI001BE7EF3E|nr:cell wall hydrolase [Paenibacillus albidus]MBT2290928.1 cell wall hydrolase [Paenibacillus albidus]